MRKLLLLLVVCCCACTTFAQSIDWNKALPADSKTKVGKLPNGITYYLRHNEEPKERASFYIIRNVGALLEDDSQDGLAHFLEHMAFNGSKNFPGNSMISTLERYGVSFGGNLNAYTTQNETVYNISEVPCTNEALVDTCLLILHDWSYYLTLADKDIDDERGVISEEWRSRRDASARIREQQNTVLLKDSKYAVRDVIGDLNVIQNFKYQEIRDFYHKWYRTDLEAIAICGDFDVDKMEQKIKDVFTSIPAIENPTPRPFYEVPEHKDTYFCVATDKESTQSTVAIIRFWKAKEQKGVVTYQDLKDGLIANFYNSMLGSRLKEMVQKGTAPFLNASIGYGEFVRGYESYDLYAIAKPNQEDAALKSVLAENARIAQHGFTETELNRVKANFLTGLESSLKDIDKTDNETYIKDMQINFLEKEGMIDFLDYYNAVKEILPTITAAEVSSKIKEWWKEDNRVIIVNGPSEGVKHLTEAEAKAIVAESETMTVDAYEDDDVSGSLINEDLKGSAIVKTKALPEFDAEEWTLANGAKVIFRKADFEKDNVALSAYSKGGTSQYDVDLLLSAQNTANLVGAYGVGDYDAIALNKVLTGKHAGCTVGIKGLYETVSGTATPQDMETMFQLLYLRFEKPRFDANVHKVMIDRNKIMLQQAESNPRTIMSDSLTMIYSNYNPRTQLLKATNIEQITLDQVEKVYRDRIADASDFTFFIVGNVEADAVKPLVEKYIGSISSTYRHENWIDRKVRSPKGKTEKVIEIPFETPKTTVIINFNKEMKYDLKQSFENTVLKEILDMRYTANIREKEGGTYGVGVFESVSREPVCEYTIGMQFDCEPDRAAHLKSLIYAEIDKLIADGVTEEELSKVVLNIQKNREQSKHHNAYWMGVLNTYYQTGINMDDAANYEQILEKLTPKDIQKYAKKLFNKIDVVDVMFVPKK